MNQPRETADQRLVAGIVDRPRLYRLLESGPARICVLRAASGSGKTTLLRNWAISRTEPTPLLWLTVHSSVGSRQGFWTRVTEAAHRAGDLTAGRSAALVAEVGGSSDPVQVAVEFLRTAGPVTFVFDAYENIGDMAVQVDQDLLRLATELPEVKIVIGTRGGTRLVDEGLQLREVVRVVSDEQLAFSEAEISELLRLHLGRQDPALTRSTGRATGGYALAVRAAVLAMSRRGVIPDAGTDDWNRLVATDLASCLPGQQAIRFVSMTSVAPYFDAALAAELTDHPAPGELLALLERQGFGRWIPYARHHPVFQYVDSVRHTFQRELRHDDGRGFRRAAGRAAQWLAGYGDHEIAFELALGAADYPLAARIYVNLLRVYPECYITDRLLRPLQSLPRGVLQQHPMLAFALGLATLANPVLRGAAGEAFLIAVRYRSTAPLVAPDIDRFIDMSVRAVSLRLIGEFGASARRSLEAIKEIEKLSPERRDELGELIAMILRQLSYSLLQDGRLNDAIAATTRSAALTRVPATYNYALAYAVGAHAYAGELTLARAALARIDPLGWPRNHEFSYLNVMTLVGEAFLLMDAGDFATALDVADRCAAYIQNAEFWVFLLGVRLLARIGLGQALSEARRVQAMMDAAVPPPGTGANAATRALSGLLAIAWLAAGRVSAAERVLSANRGRHPELVPARALHLLLTGRSASLLGRLTSWLALPGHTIRTRAATLTTGAAAACRTGDRRLAAGLLRRAHDLVAGEGVRTQLSLLPISDRVALDEIARQCGDDAVADYLASVRTDVVPSSATLLGLTRRESIVLAALTSTPSREEIARRLTVSPNTVKSQIRQIYKKLGVNNRAAAIRVAIEHELLEDGLDLAEIAQALGVEVRTAGVPAAGTPS